MPCTGITMYSGSVMSPAVGSRSRCPRGAFAHITATAPARRAVLPKPLVRLALSSWSYRKLAGLARIAEAQHVHPVEDSDD
jgi:hypothetical protein